MAIGLKRTSSVLGHIESSMPKRSRGSQIHTRYEREETVYRAKGRRATRRAVRSKVAHMRSALTDVVPDSFYIGKNGSFTSSVDQQTLVFALGGLKGDKAVEYGMRDLWNIWQAEIINRIQLEAEAVQDPAVLAGYDVGEKFDMVTLSGKTYYNDMCKNADILVSSMGLELQITPSTSCMIDFVRFVARKNCGENIANPLGNIQDNPLRMATDIQEGLPVWGSFDDNYNWGSLFDNTNFTKYFKILDIKRVQSDSSSACAQYKINRKPNKILRGGLDFDSGLTGATVSDPAIERCYKGGLTEFVAVIVHPFVSSSGALVATQLGYNCVRRYEVKVVPQNEVRTAQQRVLS